MRMTNFAYVYVFSLGFCRDWWRSSKEEKEEVLGSLKAIEDKNSKRLISLKRYASLSYHSHLVYWASSEDTTKLEEFRTSVLNSVKGYAEESNLFLSIFKPSPYTSSNEIPFSILKLQPLRYFVAYPMKKSVEWYLLPFEEREKIMKEHISTAINHPKNKGIRSFTTYSFGIGDYEFVVIYEIPDLESWTEVVEKLREVQARKWITKEEPILVGELRDLDFLIG
ncbi:chlorite dismutase family protein [Acidianus sp. RZ1]|uniref:chlorite dismutase family protein n=1 Tax=Acidianus sp. RZ1 TaxID=1540082 RepID=UPI00352FEF01